MEILTKHKLKWSNCTTAYGKSKYYSFEKNNGDLLYVHNYCKKYTIKFDFVTKLI